MLRVIIPVLALIPSLAYAGCEVLLMSCEIGRKHLEFCLNGDMVDYTFGPAGRPELILSQSVQSAGAEPWPGVGREIWAIASVENAGVTYLMATSFDRQDENAVTKGSIAVLKGDKPLARLDCDQGTVKGDLWIVADEKARRGQCWQEATGTWASAPCK